MAKKDDNVIEEAEIDPLQRAIDHAKELVRDYRDRDELLEKIDKMYFLDWEDKPTGRDFKYTVSPGPRNALLGAIRLMSNTEPKWNIPYDKNLPDAKLISEKIEKFCSSVWYHSGRFKGEPLEQTAVNTLLRYGMMVLVANSTEDLKKQAESLGTSKAEKRQLDRLVKRTPFLVEVWDPKNVYVEWGRYGITSVYRTAPMRVGELKQQHGIDCLMGVIDENTTDNDTVYYCDYWDMTHHFAWVSNYSGESEMMVGKNPIMQEKHELPCIPIVVQTADGSHVDNKREYQAIPFLYAVEKSELWERQNLELTVMYSNLFQIGNTPMFKHVNPGQKELQLDFTVPGGQFDLEAGEDITQFQKQVITPDMMQGMEIATGMIEQSTIFSQTLGQPIGSNSAYSMVALLHQAGRLPLATPQKRAGWGMGEIMEIIVEIIKDDKKNMQVLSQEDSLLVEIEKDQIPDNLIIEAILDVDLPQDTLAQSSIASALVQNGIASRRWVREHIMKMGQSDEMDKEIWTDTAAESIYNQFLENWIREMMMQTMPQQGMPPEGMPGMSDAGEMQPPPPNPGGPAMPGSALSTQEGLLPAQAPGEQPAPPPGPDELMQMQEGRMR